MKEITLLVLSFVFFSTLLLGITAETQQETSESFTYDFPNAAVAADNANCSIVGSDIMQYKGGNAIDAAVATCLCQGVLQQFASGLGGGGVAVVYIAEENSHFTLDFREFAPGAATENMFEQFPEESSLGGKSVAVPGELAGLWKLWSMYGTASWEDIVQPSIEYAESSIVSELLGMRLEEYEEYILDSPGLASIFAPNGVILKAGDELIQTALANTLRSIQANPLDFYYGATALNLVKDINAVGGIITSDDLIQYYQTGVIERECTEAFFQGIKIIGAPPPFSGGLCTSLAYNLIEPYNFALMGEDSSLAQHYLVESWKWAFSDRMALGDPAFVNLTEVTPKMLSKSHAGYLRQKFSNSTTYPPPHYVDLVPLEQTIIDGGTSHMSSVDKWGNAVALTSTVNLGFGSKVLSQSTGIILNNQMDDFSSPYQTNAFGLPPSVANYIAPYKKPLSSMTPTITFVNEELSMVIGGSGGTTIITAVMQSLLGVYSFGRSIGDAIAAPRCHNQNTGSTKVEADYNPEFISFLESTDHVIVYSDSPIACVQGIIKNSNGGLSAASDWRKLGKPAGY